MQRLLPWKNVHFNLLFLDNTEAPNGSFQWNIFERKKISQINSAKLNCWGLSKICSNKFLHLNLFIIRCHVIKQVKNKPNESNEYFFNQRAYSDAVWRLRIKAQAIPQWNILADLIPLFFSESDLLEECRCCSEMKRRVWKGRHVSSEVEEAEARPWKYNTHVCMACNTQPTSSIPYIPTAIAKHTRHADKAKGKEKDTETI